MNRRRFIATAAAANLYQPARAAVEVEISRPRNPYEALLHEIDPANDPDFPSEKAAFEIAAHLKRLTASRSLPLAEFCTGTSVHPAHHTPVAQDVSSAVFDPADKDLAAGLTRWLDSLGVIRAARFYVLPGNAVRYEIASEGQYRVGLWHQEWRDGKLIHFAPLEETLTTAPAPLFQDVTTHALAGLDSFDRQLLRGIPSWRARLDAATGIDVHGHNGIAVGDIDNDGRDEIYVCQPGGLPNRLYRNRGDGGFEDITDAAGVGVLDPTSSALFVDFRNVGLQDLVILRPDGPLLFLNRGEMRFELKPDTFRFQTAPQGNFTGMAAADYDRDGRVDLYLCTYSFFRDGGQYRYPTPYYDARNGPANFLFHNRLAADGKGIFLDVTGASGMSHNNNRFSFAPAWCDYNGDGWPDLFVANDFGRKNLYENQNGTFRDVAAEAGVEDLGDGMSASWFDYDGDGRPDLYVSNMWSDAGQRIVAAKSLQPADAWKRHAKGNSLFRNRGDGTFEETGAAEGVEMGRWAWASGGFDFDNDGTPEIFITTGMLTNSSETDLESFFWRKVAAAKPGPLYENGWNALSQAVHEEASEAGRQPNVFYVRRNNRYYDFSGVSGLDAADDSRAFAVTDFDGDGNLDLLLKSRLGPQLRIYRNGTGQKNQSVAFRLRGVKSNRDAIGAKVEVNGKVRFLEAGSGYLSQHTKDIFFGLGQETLARAVAVTWPSGLRQQFGDLPAGHRHEIEEGSASVLSTAFAPRNEIASGVPLPDNKPEFADTWLLDPVPLPEPFPGPGFLHLPESLPKGRAALYDIFCRYLFDLHAPLKLPVWFLVDANNRARKIYFSHPDAADLRRTPELPFRGKYYTPPRRNYSALGAAFFAAGLPAQALRYLELAPQDNDRVLFATGKIHLTAGRFELARSFFEKGLTISPESADGWNSLGASEVGTGNMRKALAAFQKALSAAPEMTSAMVNAGQANASLGDFVTAENMLRRAAEIDPRDPAAPNQLGELLAERKRDSEARAWFQKALEARRDYAPAVSNLAALYVRTGKPDEAVAALRYGIRVAPGEESLYLNLGSLYLRLANREAAKAVVEQLLVRRPESAKGRQALAEIERLSR